MRNIIITSGGTTEKIDEVRKITNNASGRLGKMIAETLLKNNKDIKIYFLHSKKSLLPEICDERIEFIEVDNVSSLLNATNYLLTEKKIDYYIHSMAVSDYYVDYVTDANMLSTEIEIGRTNNRETKDCILNNTNVIDNSKKISSDCDNLIIMLKKAPKVISYVKHLSPTTKLIGFKLLNGVSKEELLSVAKKLMDKNSCEYVVANDLTEIDKDNHKAYIINNNNDNVLSVNTKEEISKCLNDIINKGNQ